VRRQPELELEARLKDAAAKRTSGEIAVEALSGGTNAKRRFWLIFCSTWLQRSSGSRIPRHSCFEPAQPQGYAPTQSGGCAAERRTPSTGRTPTPRRTGSCVPDRKRHFRNSRISEKRKPMRSAKRWQQTATQMASPSRSSFRRRRIASTGWRMRPGRGNDCSNLRTQRLLAARGRGVSGQGFRTVNSYRCGCHRQASGGRQGMVSLDTDGTGPPLQLDFLALDFW